MKTTTIFAIALGLGSLAACNKSPQEQTADNIEANAENVADNIEAMGSNAAENVEANAQNTADEVRNEATRRPTPSATAPKTSKPKAAPLARRWRATGAPETERPFRTRN